MELLDKLVLQGKAENKTMTCFGAQYFALDIPFQQTIVITQIEWTPFINFPYVENRTTFYDLLPYLQYQLKISDDKNANFLHFDNTNCVFQPIGQAPNSYDANTDLTRWFAHMLFLNGPMIVIPCFLPIQTQLRMTIQRCNIQNIQVEESTLLQTSKEPVVPDGIKDLNQSVYLRDIIQQLLNYQPGIVSPIPDFFNGNKYNGYYWGASNAGSDQEIIPIDMYPNELKLFTQPLFTIHYTLIKENLIGIIN